MSERGGPQKSWWQSIPGFLTATAGVITAVTGLIVALQQIGILGQSPSESTPGEVDRPPIESDPLPSEPPVREEIDLSGTWQATDGLRYSIRQSRDLITFKGVHPIDGEAAVGEGRIEGEKVVVSYETIYGVIGEGVLDVSLAGQQLSGQVRDINTGETWLIVLTR